MQTSYEWRLDFRRLLQPGGLLTVASNLLPILGVLAWGWDVFLVLVLYWFETVIVAFWTVLRVAKGDPAEGAQVKDQGGRAWSRIALALFFTAHSGIFIAVHFVFLWGLFSGAWPQRVHGPVDFLRVVVFDTGLWIPLLFIFLVQGIGFLRQVRGEDPFRIAARTLLGDASVVTADPPPAPRPFSLGPLYARIIAMQIAIIFGGMFALALGSMAPLLILIGVKTVVDAGALAIAEGNAARA